MATEETINDVRVVFRDTIGAKLGWDLMVPMNRLGEALVAKTLELEKEAQAVQGTDEPIDDIFIPGKDVMQIVHDSLGWDTCVALVRAGVEEWDFSGDLTTDECCDELDLIEELFPIIVKARGIYLGVSPSGE